MMKAESIAVAPRRNPRIAARVVDGKALIVCVDQKQLHTLNEVGTRVWELCDGRSVDAIADQLAAEFEVERDAALRDVEHFVSELCKLGVIDAGAA